MMKVAIMQPYFLPYIGYFQLINTVDTFVIYDDVNYINKGWINRNNFLINGKPTLITIPLEGASQNKLINEVSLQNDTKWIEKMLKTIQLAYKKAPNFEQIYPIIESILRFNCDNIAAYNYNSIKKIVEYLTINTKIIASSTIYDNTNLSGQMRILDICLKENASHYINPIGGMELYSEKIFEEKKIELSFIKSNYIEYKQFTHDFVPYLSILDILMFNSVDIIKEYLVQFTLIKHG